MTFRDLYSLLPAATRTARLRALRRNLGRLDRPYSPTVRPYTLSRDRAHFAQHVRENIAEIRDLNPKTLRELSDAVSELYPLGSPLTLATFTRIVKQPSCFCQHCSHVFVESHLANLDNRLVCDRCAEDYVTCVDTGRQMHIDSTYLHDGDYCEFERARALSTLQDYHDHRDRERKIRQHGGAAGDPESAPALMVGVEWEMLVDEDCRDSAAVALDRTSFALAEADGSLDDERGMEVITGYSSLHTVNGWLSEIHKLTRPEGSEYCGLHVNISGLSYEANLQLVYFLNNHRDFHINVAGRWNNRYAYVNTCENLSDAEEIIRANDKYRQVYVRREEGYTEVRMFKGSCNVNLMLARTQYAWAVAMYCLQPRKLQELSPAHLLEWLSSPEQAVARQLCNDFFKQNSAAIASAEVPAKPVPLLASPTGPDIETFPAVNLSDISVPVTVSGQTFSLPSVASNQPVRITFPAPSSAVWANLDRPAIAALRGT
jgi:Zn finger protein HypA/HybF involved in hydrogenase expression